jgi:hypothetical protein
VWLFLNETGILVSATANFLFSTIEWKVYTWALLQLFGAGGTIATVQVVGD